MSVETVDVWCRLSTETEQRMRETLFSRTTWVGGVTSEWCCILSSDMSLTASLGQYVMAATSIHWRFVEFLCHKLLAIWTVSYHFVDSHKIQLSFRNTACWAGRIWERLIFILLSVACFPGAVVDLQECRQSYDSRVRGEGQGKCAIKD